MLAIGDLVIWKGWLAEVVEFDNSTRSMIFRGFDKGRTTYNVSCIEWEHQKYTPGENKQLWCTTIVPPVVGWCWIFNDKSRYEIVGCTEKNATVRKIGSTLDQVISRMDQEIVPPFSNPQDYWKDTNPKDAMGVDKVPMSTLSGPVLMELACAMGEGGLKYGRHNYRVAKVRYSVYFDAAQRHLWSAYEGENIDPDSGFSHEIKCMSTLHVLRDAQIRDCVIDDRPPGTNGWLKILNQKWREVRAKYPEPVPAYIGLEHPARDYVFSPSELLKAIGSGQVNLT